MNPLESSSPPSNPFNRPIFWGRQKELTVIYKYLLSTPPQCCAIIGETSFGKTTLLRNLVDPQNASVFSDLGFEDKFTFIYLDCSPYIELVSMGAFASAHFWWTVYNELQTKLRLGEQSSLAEPKLDAEQTLIDTAFEIKFELEKLIRNQQRPVILVLDNFEGVARLPLRDNEWLRSLGQRYCTYIVASRHLLYLLYQYDSKSWMQSSPLWNLFSTPIYLGLMAEDEVQAFLLQASKLSYKLGSLWDQGDLDFIRKMAGRHPEIIRIACAHLFEKRLQNHDSWKTDDNEFLEFRIYRDAGPICNQLWYGLADPELGDEPQTTKLLGEAGIQTFSPYQQALIDVAKGYDTTTEKKLLFVLEMRGMIEQVNGKWQIFAEVMRQFVLKQEQVFRSTPSRVLNPTSAPANSNVVSIRETTDTTTMDSPSAQALFPAINVFISYSHKDKELLERLKIHLAPYIENGRVEEWLWDDTQIQTGANWREDIEQALKRANAAILLISADFLASRFIRQNELPPLLESAEKEGIKIMPVILSPCGFEEYTKLSQFQAAHKLSQPLSSMRGFHKREEWWRNVAKHIYGTIIAQKTGSPLL